MIATSKLPPRFLLLFGAAFFSSARANFDRPSQEPPANFSEYAEAAIAHISAVLSQAALMFFFRLNATFIFRFKLLRIQAHTNENLRFLRSLHESRASRYDLDFWQPPTHINAAVDVAVAPLDVAPFTRDLAARAMSFDVAIDDLQRFAKLFLAAQHSKTIAAVFLSKFSKFLLPKKNNFFARSNECKFKYLIV